MRVCTLIGTLLTGLLAVAYAGAVRAALPAPREGDFVLHDFRFASGETLPELRLHYTTLGSPVRDAAGHVSNAVLILHGTGGDGHQFLQPQFADVLFGPGQLLDAARYFIILPDGIGHGHSSKPSDGAHARFPIYAYADMVAAQHAVVVEGLGVDHLRIVIGTSMGCMHGFMWGERYPEFLDALLPLACLPVQIAGRNRVWRKLIVDAIREDPDWKGGDYVEQPHQALRTAAGLLLIAGSAPIAMQKTQPTRDDADRYLGDSMARRLQTLDANDILYQVSASRDYDPAPDLERIRARVTWINSADDFINPPELAIAEAQAKRLRHGRFVLIPASAETHGHGTHTWAEFWKPWLGALLDESRH